AALVQQLLHPAPHLEELLEHRGHRVCAAHQVVVRGEALPQVPHELFQRVDRDGAHPAPSFRSIHSATVPRASGPRISAAAPVRPEPAAAVANDTPPTATHNRPYTEAPDAPAPHVP